jgi:hypothetical protein
MTFNAIFVTVLVIALALLTVTLLIITLRSRRKKAEVRPLDLSAFYAVLDREDEIYLRRKLPRREFSRLKRERIAVTWKYVTRMSDNSAAVLRLTSTALQDPDPKVAEAAAQTIDLATQIRTTCLIAFSKLAVEFTFPSMQLTPAVLAPKYESLRENVVRLGALHPRSLAPLPAII